jgi:hypothetical protein
VVARAVGRRIRPNPRPPQRQRRNGTVSPSQANSFGSSFWGLMSTDARNVADAFLGAYQAVGWMFTDAYPVLEGNTEL